MHHELPTIDVLEHGASRDGERQSINQRLFMQLLVFREQAPGTHSCAADLASAFEEAGLAGVVYDDVNDPESFAVLTWSLDPSHFVRQVRPCVRQALGTKAKLRPDFTMIGRSYGSGHEPNLPWTILDRPIETVLNEDAPWAVWYPLRRHGAFEQLDKAEQGKILMEHGIIGRAYGAQNLATDVRLACHGIDARDNEFVIGLVGKDLHPLSHVVQTMRHTRQTSEFIAQMGPFFVGYVRWRSAGS